MTADQVRQKYLDFFKTSPRNHAIIPPAPLVLANDPTTLFTSSGMQPLIPYLLGETHPQGKRLVDSQPSFRSQDIDEVGDNRHTTFFEMLGNWSLGDYFKKDQLSWFWEFLTQELNLPPDRLYVSVFEGSKSVPRDNESATIWKKLGIPKQRIFYYGVDKNWWSRSGPPDKMPAGEIGGPDSEVFFEFKKVKHNPKFGQDCHPNCDCGRFLEIGNSVFIEFQKQPDGSLKELPQKNVDFGGGLERLIAATNDDPDIFNIDLFSPARKILEAAHPTNSRKSIRIILDHLRAAIFFIDAQVLPSNKLQGYVLRRLLRRAAVHAHLANLNLKTHLNPLVTQFFKSYTSPYISFTQNKSTIINAIRAELDKFNQTLARGIKQVGKISAFNLFQTYGFPPEITQELMHSRGLEFDQHQFNQEFKKHQQRSRTAAQGMFKGGLADHSEAVTKLHTATHLLHQALRQVLGDHVHQQGSNITAERLRFDFSHSKPLTPDEIKQVENLINQKIKADLPVRKTIEDKDKALRSGALAFFKEKYPDKVSVYTIGNPQGDWFSRELCGGPHVKSTSVIGSVKIDKDQSIGNNLRRIYASLA